MLKWIHIEMIGQHHCIIEILECLSAPFKTAIWWLYCVRSLLNGWLNLWSLHKKASHKGRTTWYNQINQQFVHRNWGHATSNYTEEHVRKRHYHSRAVRIGRPSRNILPKQSWKGNVPLAKLFSIEECPLSTAVLRYNMGWCRVLVCKTRRWCMMQCDLASSSMSPRTWRAMMSSDRPDVSPKRLWTPGSFGLACPRMVGVEWFGMPFWWQLAVKDQW